jgi:hypothetical protein
LPLIIKGGPVANNEASDMIEAALNEAIKTSEDHDDGDFLVDWVVVTYVTNPDEEKGSGYPMFFSNGNLPNYRSRGLLSTGLFYVNLWQGHAEMEG